MLSTAYFGGEFGETRKLFGGGVCLFKSELEILFWKNDFLETYFLQVCLIITWDGGPGGGGGGGIWQVDVNVEDMIFAILIIASAS